MEQPRDFVRDAGQWLRTPEPLPVLLGRERDSVVAWLVKVLQTGGDMPRKYAAFVLGQIGATEVLDVLQSAHDREPVRGVKEAMGASLVALRVASENPQVSEAKRRVIITSVYDGKGLPSQFLSSR